MTFQQVNTSFAIKYFLWSQQNILSTYQTVLKRLPELLALQSVFDLVIFFVLF